MDGTEDSSYLTLLNDGTHNYLLQTTEEALGVQEPMFTEIEDGSGSWSVGLPILMNSNLIPEADQELETPLDLPTEEVMLLDNEVSDLPASLPELYENSLENQEDASLQEGELEDQMRYPIEIPGKGFITADGLFIANDILLELKLDGEDLDLVQPSSDIVTKIPHVTEQDDLLINPKTLVPHNGHAASKDELIDDQGNLFNGNSNINNNLDLTNGQIFDAPSLNPPNDIIRLLNMDGTIVNISKKQLLNYDISKDELKSADSERKERALDACVESTAELFDVVVAHKCKQCLFLCETQCDMIQHLKKEHLAVQMQPQILNNEPAEEQTPITKDGNSKEVEEKNGLLRCNGEMKMKSILKGGDHQTVYICSECKLGYGSTQKLRAHMICAHKLVRQPTDVMDEKDVVVNGNSKSPVMKPKLSVALVQKQAKASKKIKCSVKGCDLRFALEEMRIRHEKCHVEGQKKQFKCYECDNKFSLWRVCSMHMWKCHKLDLGLFTCPMCSIFKASSAVGLVTHMALHEEDKPYLCTDCGKTFKQHAQLRNHQVLHKNVVTVPEWAVQQKCDICKKFFANSKSLKKHVQSVHDKFKPFICNICGHTTARKAMLELHLRQHTGEKPHRCTMCDYKTGDHNSLRRHIMRHSGHTKYSCPHCKYQSIQSTSYKNHVASKHPGLGGSYFCNLCSHHTVNENTYISHMADHKNGFIKESSDDNDYSDDLQKTVSLNEETFASAENQIKKRKVSKDVNHDDDDDDETQNYLQLLDHSNDAVDRGGITIPAGFELQVPL